MDGGMDRMRTVQRPPRRFVPARRWLRSRLWYFVFGRVIYIDPADWWVGYYRGPNHHYVCLLPTVVIRWRRGAA
jgi:hypothetical protein